MRGAGGCRVGAGGRAAGCDRRARAARAGGGGGGGGGGDTPASTPIEADDEPDTAQPMGRVQRLRAERLAAGASAEGRRAPPPPPPPTLPTAPPPGPRSADLADAAARLLFLAAWANDPVAETGLAAVADAAAGEGVAAAAADAGGGEGAAVPPAAVVAPRIEEL